MKRQAGMVLLLACLAGRAAGQGADFTQLRDEARRELVHALATHAEWCTEKRLFKERESVLTLVLELDPEHVEAHKLLGYTRQRDGSWKAPDKPRPPRDFDPKALAEAPARRAAAQAEFVTRMLAMLEQDGLAPGERELVLTDVLALEPDHARAHELRGDVRDGERWVLPETVAARARREELRALVQRAFAEARPATEVAPNERERAFGRAWKAVAAGELRVVGSVPPEELALCAQAVQALERFAQAVFASQYALPKELEVFLFDAPEQKAVFLEKHPAIPAEARASYLPLEGGGVHGTADFAFWTGDAQRRIDGIVRLVLGYWLAGAFEVHVEHGWMYEGFGLFLTRSLVRSRLTWLAQPSKTLPSQEDLVLRQKLLEPASNWVDEAHRLLVAGKAPALGELVQKGASELTTEDVLLSYALATFLIEARSERVPELFASVGRGVPDLQALGEAVGVAPELLPARLQRWMEERK